MPFAAMYLDLEIIMLSEVRKISLMYGYKIWHKIIYETETNSQT